MKRTWNEANRRQPSPNQAEAITNGWTPKSQSQPQPQPQPRLSSPPASGPGTMAPAPGESRDLTRAAHPNRPNSPDHANSHQSQLLSAAGKAGVKLPAITRKVKACAACRKQKLKCDMERDQPPCTRCVRRGLPCVLNKSLQSLFEASTQTQAMQQDIQNIFSTLVELCSHNNLQPPKPLQIRPLGVLKIDTEPQQDARYEDEDDSVAASRPLSPSDMEAPINAFLEASKKIEPLPEVAAASPYGSTTSKAGASKQDLISSGIISLDMANRLVRSYLDRLDHYLYGIGSSYTDLKGLRSSPVLLAAVCTISALHEEDETQVYEACSQELQRLVSKSLFENRGVEYLRALCIGSYWLSDVSRILNGDALRRAADVRLPKYFYELAVLDAPSQKHISDLPQTAKLDRIRLWYLFYICDQHLSILYNRDPVVHGNRELVSGWETYLEFDKTDGTDVRIASQVALLSMMAEVRTMFGGESTEPVSKALTTSFNNYGRQIDQWFSRFSPMFKPHSQIGNFPHQGLTLHYHFAKLYLGHHVFRGLNYGPIPSYFLPTALMAHNASISIFELVLEEDGLKDSLIGVPFYFHVMMSFAGQFMLSCCPYSGQLCVEAKNNIDLVSKAIGVFKSIACISSHPLRKMTAVLERRLNELKAILDGTTHANVHANGGAAAMAGDTSFDLFQPPSSDHFWGSFQTSNLRAERNEADKAQAGYLGGYPDAMSGMVRPGDGAGYPSGSVESFGMAPPTRPSNMSSDGVFQDFAGVDFPSFHMNFTNNG